MKKRKYKRRKKQKSLILPILLLGLLVCLVLITSGVVFTDITTNMSINRREKATFVYTDKNDEIITISNEMLFSDQISMNSNNIYKFSIRNKKINDNYTITITKVNSKIEDKYIKFYLTDENNKKLEGFNKPIRLSDLPEVNNYRILYSSKFKGDKKKFYLRAWVSDKYKSKSIDHFSFKVNIEN